MLPSFRKNIAFWGICGMFIKGGKQKYSEKNQSCCHSFHHKSHTERPVIEPDPLRSNEIRVTFTRIVTNSLRVTLLHVELGSIQPCAWTRLASFLCIVSKCGLVVAGSVVGVTATFWVGSTLFGLKKVDNFFKNLVIAVWAVTSSRKWL